MCARRGAWPPTVQQKREFCMKVVVMAGSPEVPPAPRAGSFGSPGLGPGLVAAGSAEAVSVSRGRLQKCRLSPPERAAWPASPWRPGSALGALWIGAGGS